MKSSPTAEDIEILLLEPRSQMRASLKDLLMRYVARRVQDVSLVTDLEAALADATPDLLVCDVDDASDPVLRIIRGVRRGTTGRNPFMVILCTTWNPTVGLASLVTQAGADDLVVKPLSQQVLLQRIETLVERRKRFVVTSDYIGPDRRLLEREGDTRLREVPNTLRAKARGERRGRNLQAEIDRTFAALDTERVLRHAEQVALVVEIVTSDRPPPNPEIYLSTLRPIAMDLLHRLRDPTPEVEAAARAILRLAEQLMEADRIDPAAARGEATKILSLFSPGADPDALWEAVRQEAARRRARAEARQPHPEDA